MQPQSGEEPATPQQQQWQQCSTAQQQQQQDQPDTGTHKDTAGAHSTITVAHTQSDGVSSPLHTFKRQVTFPADDAIAVVHQLHPSSSAGDLCTPCYHEKDPVPPPGCWSRFKASVKQLKRDVLALYYAVHDPRTPLLSKLLPWLVLAYALSPIDLIPDFIPVLGFLDDMLLLPLGLWLSYKLIPAQVLEDSRDRAAVEPLLLHKNWVVATLIFALWCAGILWLEYWLVGRYGSLQLQQWKWPMVAGTGAAAAVVFLVWVVLRVRHERRRHEQQDDALLVGYDSSDDEV